MACKHGAGEQMGSRGISQPCLSLKYFLLAHKRGQQEAQVSTSDLVGLAAHVVPSCKG